MVVRLQEAGTYPTWVLLASLGGIFAASFPVTILTVSLGSIADEFGARETTVAWVISAPLLLSAVALPILGKLGDLYGHRKVFLLGFGAASLSSAATGIAWDVGSLIVLRSVSAVVGAATMPTAMALILSVHQGDDRVRAMGWWSMTGAAAPAFGLVAGGPLVQLLGWRTLFLVQSGLAMLALALAFVILQETRKRETRLDVLGSLVLAVGVAGLMLALGRFRELHWSDPWIWGSFLVGLVGVRLFVAVERRAEQPLLPLEFFSKPNFSAGIISNTFNAGAYMGAFAVAPLLFIGVFDYSIMATSGIMLMRTISLTIASPLGGRMGARVGERRTALFGCAVMTVGLLVVSLGAFLVSIPFMGVGLILQGLGHGFAQPPLTSAAVGAVPDADLGIASATNRLTSQLGVAFGITTLMVVYAGQNEPEAFARAFLAAAGLSVLSLVAALWMQKKLPAPA